MIAVLRNEHEDCGWLAGRRAFALMELLVAVTIIALLAATLIPSLGRAREQARLALCRSNLHQLGVAMHVYAGPADRLVPGDLSMGHDVWNAPNEGPAAGTGFQPVNLGHLLAARCLPMPSSEQHPFYCPTLSRTGSKWSFTYRNSGPYAAVAPRGFEGWGKPGRLVNIGYEYRDSIDGTPGALPALANRLGQAIKRALIADVFSWGSGQWGHRTRYNFVRGDGSVSSLFDSGYPMYIYMRFNSTTFGDDYLAFRAFDRMKVKGILWP
jgi:prepilin-type N-terminal cleavage/methylation domain-containing protein